MVLWLLCVELGLLGGGLERAVSPYHDNDDDSGDDNDGHGNDDVDGGHGDERM